MRKLIIVICFLLTLAACKSEENCCDTTGIDKEWLDIQIADINKSELKQYFYIMRAEYEGQCVVYVNNCCPMCMTAIIVYSCDGKKLENVDHTKLKNHTVVWKSENNVCTL